MELTLEDELRIEYKRLSRHVNFLEKRYSPSVARDLAASLRNWAQLEKQIQKLIEDEAWDIKFAKGVTSKTTKRIRSQSDSFAIPLQGSVKSKNMQIAGASIHYGKLSQEDVKKMYQEGISTKPTPQPMTLESWLNTAVYHAHVEGAKTDIPRRVFIDRAANLLGGTHPINNFVKSEHATPFDPYIVDSLKTQVGLWPVPYAILMESAQDLLRAFKPYLDE